MFKLSRPERAGDRLRRRRISTPYRVLKTMFLDGSLYVTTTLPEVRNVLVKRGWTLVEEADVTRDSSPPVDPTPAPPDVAPVVEPEPAPVAEPVAAEPAVAGASLTELRAEAKRLKIVGRSKMNREKLIAAIADSGE